MEEMGVIAMLSILGEIGVLVILSIIVSLKPLKCPALSTLNLQLTALGFMLLFLPSLSLAQPAQNEYLWGMNFLKLEQEERAIVSFYKAAKKGNPDAQYRLGLMYLHGIATVQDTPGAIKLFKRAAKQKQTDALRLLANFYFYGDSVKQDRSIAAQYYKNLADATGDSLAFFMLGSMYEYGDGVPQNDSIAFNYYKASADRGFAEAAYSAGYLCERYGAGSQAATYYAQAADGGVSDARYNLSLLLFNTATPDTLLALQTLRQAAVEGSRHARYALALRYERGEGVPKDSLQALHYYQLAAAADLPEAQYALAQHHLSHDDAPRALPLLARAANAGYLPAMHALATLYEKGAKGIRQDPSKAKYWQRKAEIQL